MTKAYLPPAGKKISYRSQPPRGGGYRLAMNIVHADPSDTGGAKPWGPNTSVEKTLIYFGDASQFYLSIRLHETDIVTWCKTDGLVYVTWMTGGWITSNSKPTPVTRSRLNYWLPDWKNMKEDVPYPWRTDLNIPDVRGGGSENLSGSMRRGSLHLI